MLEDSTRKEKRLCCQQCSFVVKTRGHSSGPQKKSMVESDDILAVSARAEHFQI